MPIREHGWFLLPLVPAFLTGLILRLQIPYGQEILWLNVWRFEPLNSFFRFATLWGEVYAYGIAVLVLLFINRKYALLIALCGLSTLLLSFWLKDMAAVPRPHTWLEQVGQRSELVAVPGVELASGKTSFPSGHTMSAFALFSLLAFMLRPPYRIWGAFFALAAILVGISRIFLAQHFIADVLAGALWGLALALLIWRVFREKRE